MALRAMTHGAQASPTTDNPFAVASIIASMTLVAIANGLMFAYVPIRLGHDGYDPVWAGSIATALSAGGMVGCLAASPLVRRIGHPRAYLAFSAIIIASDAMIALAVEPRLWLLARILYGFGINGLFIVSQSWLNDAVANNVRGRVMAVFYTLYIMGLGTGSLLLRPIAIESHAGPVIAVLIAAVSLLPVGLTRLPAPPPPPPSAGISIRRAWAISPVAVAGMFAVGGMSMLVGSFTPIHLSAIGHGKNEVALLLFAMPFGTLLVQWPAGWLSDRVDRRMVLVGLAVMSALGGIASGFVEGAAFAAMMAVFILWDGATESIYAVSSAYAGDRAAKEDQVMMSGTLLFCWALSAFIAPGVATALTARFGTGAFYPLAVGFAVVFAGFVIWRLTLREAQPGGHVGFAPHPVQAPQIPETQFPEDGTGKAQTP